MWVSSDPDLDDGRVRWDDRDQHQWPTIAAAVAAVGDYLAAGAWTPHTYDEDEVPDHGTVTIPTPDRLTATEREIVEAWFSHGESVMVDPLWEPLMNGRHRLWATMPHFNGALVPITSEALQYTDPRSIQALGEGRHELYVDHATQLRECRWFDTADPLNNRFLAAVEAAARGESPARADVPVSEPVPSGHRRQSLWPRFARRLT